MMIPNGKKFLEISAKLAYLNDLLAVAVQLLAESVDNTMVNNDPLRRKSMRKIMF